MKMKKNDFNAGSPYSSWLKEEMISELFDSDNRGLAKKHNVKADKYAMTFIYECVEKLDDYPDDLRKIAVDIIRIELDSTFEK